jgi:hypothetical protein
MTTPTPTPAPPGPDPTEQIRYHRGRIGAVTFWWVSIDGVTYLHPDYPTKAAARTAALAYLARTATAGGEAR